MTTRTFWLAQMEKIARPVLEAATCNRLRKEMARYSKNPNTALTALGRTLAGLAPWLELEAVFDAKERQLQKEFRQLALASIAHAVDPTNPEKLDFSDANGTGEQPLVAAAFLAHALIRAPKQLIKQLSEVTRQQLLHEFRCSRDLLQHDDDSWVLFAAMVEAALHQLGDPNCDLLHINHAFSLLDQWYVGDGIYGDGTSFANDYYNSFVIQPMLVDLVKRYPVIATNPQPQDLSFPTKVMARGTRFAQLQELLINTDGTYPVYGRLMCYRFGCFQHLAQAALQGFLPETLSGGQVRSALTAVMEKVLSAPDTFDKHGFLTVGVYGSQPTMGEPEINVGSCYLCLGVMLPLGLSEITSFWADPATDWTAKKIWSGQPVQRDQAYQE